MPNKEHDPTGEIKGLIAAYEGALGFKEGVAFIKDADNAAKLVAILLSVFSALKDVGISLEKIARKQETRLVKLEDIIEGVEEDDARKRSIKKAELH